MKHYIEVKAREYEPGKWVHDIHVDGQLRTPAVGLKILPEIIRRIVVSLGIDPVQTLPLGM